MVGLYLSFLGSLRMRILSEVNECDDGEKTIQVFLYHDLCCSGGKHRDSGSTWV